MPASDSGATYTSGRRPKAAKERTRGDGARRMPRTPLWALILVGPREVEKLIDASQHLSSLGFDITDNWVGGDAGEIGDVAVNDCLANDRLTAILA